MNILLQRTMSMSSGIEINANVDIVDNDLINNLNKFPEYYITNYLYEKNHFFYLTFFNPFLEQKYQLHHYALYVTSIRNALIILCLLYCIWWII